MMLTGAASGQPAVEVGGIQPIVDANIPPSRQWTHHLTFPESIDGVRSMAFAPDRESIYVLYGVKVIDMWAVLVHRWPEVLGAVVVIVTLVALLLVRHVMKRPQLEGAPHCRRCGYEVTGQAGRTAEGGFEIAAGARCPECGVELSRKQPVRGRRTVARAWPIAAVWAVVAGTYAGMLVAGVPRDGRVSGWRDWSSSGLAAWAMNRGVLKSEVRDGSRMVRVDLARGMVDRVVATRNKLLSAGILVTPDGRSILYGNVLSQSYYTPDTPIVQLDARSGREGRRLTPSSIVSAPQIFILIGFTSDSREAIVTTLQSVVAFRLDDGSLRELIAKEWSDVVVTARNNADRLYEWSGAHGGIIERSVSGSSVEGGSVDREIVSGLYGRYPPVISDDGTRLVICDRFLRDIDLKAGTAVRTTSAGGLRPFYEFVAVDAAGKYAVVNTRDGFLLVRDLDLASWIAQLALPASVFAGEPQVSPNTRWIAGDCLGGNGGTVPFHHDLVLWNFAEVLETSGAAEPTDPGNDPP